MEKRVIDKETKSRIWTGSLYPENMVDGWEDIIARVIQLPACYIIHNKDLNNDNEGRKIHVHLMVVWRNNTTYKAALGLFNRLSKVGVSNVTHQSIKCCPFVEQVLNVRNLYDYFIHDTDDARKKGKFLYSKEERKEINGFDIGLYEQITTEEKEEILEELEELALQPEFMNFKRLTMYVIKNYDKEYKRVLRNYSGYLERITKGNYLDFRLDGLDYEAAQRVIDFHDSNERDKRRNNS